MLCGAECESVVHVVWECSAYRYYYLCGEALGALISEFDKLNGIEKTAYVLGSELWEYDFDDLLSLVKEYVVGVWDVRKQKLYGDNLCPSQLQSLAEDLQLAGVRGKWMVSYVPQVREVRICLYVHVYVAPPMIVGAWSMAVNKCCI